MKYFTILLIFYSALLAGTYDDSYKLKSLNSVEDSNIDQFMYGDFKEIKRFAKLDFSDDELEDESIEIFNDIVKSIQKYIVNEDIKVKIIGHAAIDKDDDNESIEDSYKYMHEVYQSLINKGVDKNILYPEYRGLKDPAYLATSSNNIDLSNRVMVTIYVLNKQNEVVIEKDKDSDMDGVFDLHDKCPDTPLGVKVDPKGCPLDSDKDGVSDFVDKCPDTPFGIEVDSKGCPFDTDKDGVLDYKDKCPDTIGGLRVDDIGCPIARELKLNFAIDSYKIPKKSFDQVEEFATFMQENPAYNARIIGHTDSIGKSSYNMVLSLNRAKSVKEALVQKGIDPSRLEAIGKGELVPLQTNRTKVGRAANRRIEVTLFY